MASITVTAIVHTPVIPPDVSEPVLQEIESILEVPVRRSPIDQEPPAAGMSELAMVLEMVANALAIATFLAGLGLAARGKGAGRFQTLLGEGKQSQASNRTYTPLSLCMVIEPSKTSVWAHFHGDPNPEELGQRFDSLAERVQALTDSDLAEFMGPPECGYFFGTILPVTGVRGYLSLLART